MDFLPSFQVKSRDLNSTILSSIDKYPNRIRYLFTDSYYTNMELAYELLKKNIYMTGISRGNRKYLPDLIKNTKFKKNKMIVFESADERVRIGKLKDKKKITLITTFDNFEMITTSKHKQKHRIINNYNTYSKGVDLMNQYTQYYR